MTHSRALLQIPLAAAMLTLAALDGLMLEALVAAGLQQEQVEPVMPWITAGLAGAGFVLLVLGLVSFVTATTREQRWRPYVTVLKPFAAEFGRGVAETPTGIRIEVTRENQVVEIHVDPRPGGHLVVRSTPPARQALSWFRVADKPPAGASHWREVERTEQWQLRAELPAMARPLLADTALMDVIRRFFAVHEGVAVTHTLQGMLIHAGLAPADAVDAQVRACVEIAFRLRRVNG